MEPAGAAHAFRTRSVEQARDHLASVFAVHRLACAAREIDFRLHRRDHSQTSIMRLAYGAEVVVDAPALERFYLLQLTLTGGCDIDLGRRRVSVGPGELLVVNPTRPYRKRWSADCTQLIARIDRTAVDAAWTARQGEAPRGPLEFAFAKLPAPAAAAVAASLHGAATWGPERFPLAAALMAALPPAEHDAARPPAQAVVNRAEAFMLACLGLDLDIADIAQAAGVTARTLERAFRRERRTTPVARLLALRLEHARDALVAARGSGRSVTAIAASVGLIQPGRFAVAYRRRFGESPSVTLHAATGERHS
jgi:AraC-like DNA-binding protein